MECLSCGKNRTQLLFFRGRWICQECAGYKRHNIYTRATKETRLIKHVERWVKIKFLMKYTQIDPEAYNGYIRMFVSLMDEFTVNLGRVEKNYKALEKL